MQQKCNESARERRIALYESDYQSVALINRKQNGLGERVQSSLDSQRGCHCHHHQMMMVMAMVGGDVCIVHTGFTLCHTLARIMAVFVST